MQGKTESGPKPRQSNAVRSENMRVGLMDVARKLFAQKGFADTGTPEIVKLANVTRGALYHHFADKTDLFRAVVRVEARAVAETIAAQSSTSESAAAAIRDGAGAYFDAMKVPGRARILLLDGPAILGPAEMAGIDRDTGLATLRAGLQAVLGKGDFPLDALSEIISAGFERAALGIAHGADPKPYEDAISLIMENLGGIRPPG